MQWKTVTMKLRAIVKCTNCNNEIESESAICVKWETIRRVKKWHNTMWGMKKLVKLHCTYGVPAQCKGNKFGNISLFYIVLLSLPQYFSIINTFFIIILNPPFIHLLFKGKLNIIYLLLYFYKTLLKKYY